KSGHQGCSMPVEWSSPDGRIWLQVMAHIGLSREERRTWGQFTGPGKRRLEWLLARLTGKDAVRRLLRECYGLEVWLADIEIYPDPKGKPLVRGEWLERISAAPALSLTHSHGFAVALAADGAAGLSVGIDIELRQRPGKGFPDLAFAPEEQQLLPSQESPDFAEWCLRFWCAKEAVAKALGRGLVNVLRDLKVVEANRQKGEVRVAVTPKLAQDYPRLADNPVQAFTAREGELIVASSFLGGISGNSETARDTYKHDLKSVMDSR
ncbi:MAG: 4'-phosphopantetheinyl transferase superfamily protein, partial [Desulfobaccales bacterium]